jgi:hypothetical protein
VVLFAVPRYPVSLPGGSILLLCDLCRFFNMSVSEVNNLHLHLLLRFHHFYYGIHIIRRSAVHFFRATLLAAMYNLPAFFTMGTNSQWFHRTKTIICPVAGVIVNMHRIKTTGTMITVTPVGQRIHIRTAMGAGKTCVFCFSTHTEPPDI